MNCRKKLYQSPEGATPDFQTASGVSFRCRTVCLNPPKGSHPISTADIKRGWGRFYLYQSPEGVPPNFHIYRPLKPLGIRTVSIPRRGPARFPDLFYDRGLTHLELYQSPEGVPPDFHLATSWRLQFTLMACINPPKGSHPISSADIRPPH